MRNHTIWSEKVKDFNVVFAKIEKSLNIAKTDKCRSRLFQATLKLSSYLTAEYLRHIW